MSRIRGKSGGRLARGRCVVCAESRERRVRRVPAEKSFGGRANHARALKDHPNRVGPMKKAYHSQQHRLLRAGCDNKTEVLATREPTERKVCAAPMSNDARVVVT